MIYEPGISERRDSRRYTYQAIVECALPVNECGTGRDPYFSALTQNVGRSGVGLYSIQPFITGQELDIRFETSSSQGFTRYMVCWVEKVGPENYLAGLKRVS